MEPPGSCSVAADLPEQHSHGIVKLVDHALFERDDGVVGDVNVLRANLSTTLGDIAIAQAKLILQQAGAVATVERMHFQASDSNEEARAGELLLLVVFAKNMADVLAKKTFDALSKLLHAIHIELGDFPGHAGARFESRNFAVDTIVPRNVGDKVLDCGKGFHGEDGDGLVLREIVHTRFASQAGAAVDFRGAGAALPCFAVPANRKIGSEVPLDIVQCIENHHARGNGNAIVHGLSGVRIASENA